jgi:hypothetical protein
MFFSPVRIHLSQARVWLERLVLDNLALALPNAPRRRRYGGQDNDRLQDTIAAQKRSARCAVRGRARSILRMEGSLRLAVLPVRDLHSAGGGLFGELRRRAALGIKVMRSPRTQQAESRQQGGRQGVVHTWWGWRRCARAGTGGS